MAAAGSISGPVLQLILVLVGQRTRSLRDGDAELEGTSAVQDGNGDQERRRISISPNNTVSDLKTREFPPATRVRLIHRGAELRDDSAKLGVQCGLRDGDILHCVVTHIVTAVPSRFISEGGGSSLIASRLGTSNNSSTRVVFALLGSLLLLAWMIYLSLPSGNDSSSDDYTLSASDLLSGLTGLTAMRRGLVVATVAAGCSGLLLLYPRRPR
jgi:hypothetical protein